MASTPSNSRTTFVANTGLGLKLTPTNSPYARTPRSPNKIRGIYELGLSLKRIIGTTVSSPTAFDSLPSSGIFAYTAGAAAVVVNIDENSKYSQRFYRARPTAVPQSPGNQNLGAPSTPTNTANDGRNRSIAGLRDSVLPHSPSTPYINLEWGDSPASKTWTSRERIKAATCLSISRDGRFLAVGETGYSPRVLIFSLQDNSSDTPLAILNEHTFGVRAVAFSPDQKYLATLGSPNDGFLHVWAINQRTGAARLHSSNKCTSFIKQITWLGNNVVTIGTRHIKIWRVEESRSVSPSKKRYALDGTPLPVPTQPVLKTLAGRNILLGPLVEAVFTTVAVVSDHKAIVCSEKGDICLIDDSEGQKLVKLGSTGFSISCLAVDLHSRQVRIGGLNGKIKSIDLDTLLTPITPPESPVPSDELLRSSGHICAIGYAGRSLVTIDSKHSIEISSLDSEELGSKPQDIPFPAHGDAVLGVQLVSPGNEMGAAFLTWSADGTIVFWDLDGSSKGVINVEVEQLSSSDEDPTNQCNIVRASNAAAFLVTGDRYGVLRVINTKSKECVFEVRAHMTDIQDIAIYEKDGTILVASCGRDRTIQLFRRHSNEWALLQTLEDHSASVNCVLFAENGEKLISCSTDRTIQIRQLLKKDVAGQELIVAVPDRIITVKASPISMAPCLGDQQGTFVVSLLDRTVATYEISTGKLVTSFRATESDGHEAVALDGLSVGIPSTQSGRPTILAGFSSTDKSVRVYDGSTGFFLDREWGHTAAVTDIALLETPDSDQKTLISTGSDGTIMIWHLSPRAPELGEPLDVADSRDPSPPKDAPLARPPLRRVLSRAEMAEFQRVSPVSTPTGRTSPPRILRRKSSRYGLSTQSPTLAPPMPSLPFKNFSSASEDSGGKPKKTQSRGRSRSPTSPKMSKGTRRPSLASTSSGSLRGRTKSTPGNFSEFGTLNMATEQACRTLRAYRKKLASSESVREDILKELDQELRLTVSALSEKSMKNRKETGITEEILTDLLDQYSERLVSLFDEKLRLTKTDSFESALTGSSRTPESEGNGDEKERERPRTAGGAVGSTLVTR